MPHCGQGPGTPVENIVWLDQQLEKTKEQTDKPVIYIISSTTGQGSITGTDVRTACSQTGKAESNAFAGKGT